MNSRCYNCYRPLLTGDTDGLCQVCRNQKQRNTVYVAPDEIEAELIVDKYLNEEMENHEKQLDIHRSEYIAKLETELEELKRDVKRYFELKNHSDYPFAFGGNLSIEMFEVTEKLSKVGEKE